METIVKEGHKEVIRTISERLEVIIEDLNRLMAAEKKEPTPDVRALEGLRTAEFFVEEADDNLQEILI